MKNNTDKDLRVHARLWVELNAQSWLGPGRVRLLSALDSEGSISAAARKLGMSYHKAWTLVDSMNAGSSQDLVTRNAGGRRGGGTRLTAYGQRVMQVFLQSQARVEVLLQSLEQDMRQVYIAKNVTKDN